VQFRVQELLLTTYPVAQLAQTLGDEQEMQLVRLQK
jgi:hypothetical protein